MPPIVFMGKIESSPNSLKRIPEGDNINIQIAEQAELPLILSLIRAQWPYFTDNDYEIRDLWLVAKYRGIIVGCTSFVREEKSGYVFLQDLVVQKPYRNKGLGCQLIFTGIDFFLRPDEQLIALVSTMNRQAIAFYKHIGFEKLVAKDIKSQSNIGKKPHNKNCMAWGLRKSHTKSYSDTRADQYATQMPIGVSVGGEAE